MNRSRSLVLGFLLASIQTQEAGAQWNVARFSSAPNRAYITFGLDPALVTSVGYARVISLRGRSVQLACDGALAAGETDLHDFRARLGVQSSIVHWKSMHLVGSAAFITRGTDNIIYQGLNFGSDFTGSLGVYRPRWFSAAEFGFDKAIITHISHSDWYRTYYYADAKDGWYLPTGGTFHYGLAGGIQLGRAEVVARFGWTQTEDLNDLTPPLYATLGVGVAF